MSAKPTTANTLIYTIQAEFQKTDPAGQTRILNQLQSWIEQENALKKQPHETVTPNQLFQQHIQTIPLMKQITENIEQAIWIQAVNNNELLYISTSIETIWMISSESLYAKPSLLLECVHPEDRVQVLAAWSQPAQIPFQVVFRIIHPDDSLRWVTARIFTIQNEITEEIYRVFIAQDISDQKKIEFTLRNTLDRSREQFTLSHKMSLARKPEAVLKTLMSANELRSAEQAVLLYFNHPKYEVSTGVEITSIWKSDPNLPDWLLIENITEEPALSEIFKTNRVMYIAGTHSSNFPPFLNEFLKKNKIKTLITFPIITTGRQLGSLLIGYEENQRIDHINLRQLKVLVDQAAITLYNLQLLETEEESRHEAERANEIKTEFLAMISHELRTPLTSIIGFTTTLLADDVAWKAHEQNDFIQTIQHEANRLQELIDHLLDLSQLEVGMLPINMQPHTIQNIIDDVLPQLQILTRNHTLNLNIPANLPQIYVDALRIGQVMVNLIQNASIYAPKNTEISIHGCVRAQFVQIDIMDHGPGIPPGEYKKIFKAFQRGKKARQSAAPGAGLGLAICKGLVEAHGGRIWIRKKSDTGTTVSFTVPRYPANTLTESSTKEEK